MQSVVVPRPRRWRLLRAGFTNWPLPALLAFVAHRTGRAGSGPLMAVGAVRCQLRARSGSVLTARVQDLGAPAEVFGRGEYDLPGIHWPGVEHVVDLGGHVGSFTVWAAERSRASFYVIEPNPAVFELLARNVERLVACGRVRLRGAALAGRSGRGWLELRQDDSAATRLLPSPAGAGLEVDTITLDQALRESAFPRVDVVKMDIEGREYEVLGAAGPDLLRSVRHWIVECHPSPEGDAGAVSRLFQQAGYDTSLIAKPDQLRLLVASRRAG